MPSAAQCSSKVTTTSFFSSEAVRPSRRGVGAPGYGNVKEEPTSISPSFCTTKVAPPETVHVTVPVTTQPGIPSTESGGEKSGSEGTRSIAAFLPGSPAS